VVFQGVFDYSMDDRGRVPIPPIHREAFRPGIVLGQGSPDPCVRIYTKSKFDQLSEQILAMSTWLDEGRDMRRLFFSRTLETRIDPQHRVLVPGFLREHANLRDKVIVIGAGDWLEIWAPEAYDSDIDRIQTTIRPTLRRIVELEQR
jgi:MraZ protein